MSRLFVSTNKPSTRHSRYPRDLEPFPGDIDSFGALCHVDLPLVDPAFRGAEYAATRSSVGQVRQIRLRPRSGGWRSGAQLR